MSDVGLQSRLSNLINNHKLQAIKACIDKGDKNIGEVDSIQQLHFCFEKDEGGNSHVLVLTVEGDTDEICIQIIEKYHSISLDSISSDNIKMHNYINTAKSTCKNNEERQLIALNQYANLQGKYALRDGLCKMTKVIKIVFRLNFGAMYIIHRQKDRFDLFRYRR